MRVPEVASCEQFLRRVGLKTESDIRIDSCVIFGAITIFGFVTYWITPEDQWLPNARLGKLRELGLHETAKGPAQRE